MFLRRDSEWELSYFRLFFLIRVDRFDLRRMRGDFPEGCTAFDLCDVCLARLGGYADGTCVKCQNISICTQCMQRFDPDRLYPLAPGQNLFRSELDWTGPGLDPLQRGDAICLRCGLYNPSGKQIVAFERFQRIKDLIDVLLNRRNPMGALLAAFRGWLKVSEVHRRGLPWTLLELSPVATFLTAAEEGKLDTSSRLFDPVLTMDEVPELPGGAAYRSASLRLRRVPSTQMEASVAVRLLDQSSSSTDPWPAQSVSVPEGWAPLRNASGALTPPWKAPPPQEELPLPLPERQEDGPRQPAGSIRQAAPSASSAPPKMKAPPPGAVRLGRQPSQAPPARARLRPIRSPPLRIPLRFAAVTTDGDRSHGNGSSDPAVVGLVAAVCSEPDAIGRRT